MQADHTTQEDFLEIQRWAATTPGAVALASPGREALTYAGLWDLVRASSEAFSRAGLRSGAVAAIALPSEPSFVTAALAITLRSACAPLDPSLTRDEYQAYLQRLGASTLVVAQGAASAAAEAARQLGITVIRIRSSEESPAGVFSVAEIETPREAIAARETDAVFILLTSSTTGVPKLVPWSRENVRAAVLQDIRAFQLTSADRFLALMPLHASHSIYTLLTQLACGGSVGFPVSLDAASIFAALESFRPTWFSSGPATHTMLLARARENPKFFQEIPLRFVRSGGAPPELGLLATLETLLGAPVLDSYGLTEIPGVARNTPSERKPGSLGRSVGTELAILDDSANLLPPGQAGEIAARGPTLMRGYLGDPEANQAAFHNGWFRTGDIGHIDGDGFLFLTGRKKEMINRGGTKISPREVDDVLARHPSVADVAVFAIPHRTLGEDVAAAVVLRAAAEVSELDLRRFTSDHLAAYKVPRRIVFVQSIPRTAVGRPKRGALTEEFGDLLTSRTAGQPGSPSTQRPPMQAEAQLIEIWRHILGVVQIGIEDNFFDLGGDSLSATLMLAQAETLVLGGRHLDGSDFFDQPTIAALARILAEAASNAQETTRNQRNLVLHGDGSRNPFFCFTSSITRPYELLHLSREVGLQQPFVALSPPPAHQSNRLLTVQEVASQSLDAIRGLQKHGPYVIGGYCYGGVVAFEAALQLAEQGEEVALLALLDTPAPGYPKIARHWKRYARQSADALRGLLHGKAVITAKDVAAHALALRHIVGRRLGGKVNRALVAPGSPVPRTDDEWNRVVMREYVPRPFPSRIVQFLATDTHVSIAVLDDPRSAWQDFARDGFETRSVPGDHVTMLHEANAPMLAAELERVLEAAVPACQGSGRWGMH